MIFYDSALNFSKFFPEIGEEIWYYPVLERAMALSIDLIKKFPNRANGRIIWASELTQAKGRFQRKWFASKGGLWFSLSIFDEFLSTTQSFIPLSVGLALIKAIHRFGVKEAKLKWINDIHLNGRKLAGVLIEKWKDWYIIGIGVNVNNPLPFFLPAISLKQIFKKEVSILKCFALIIYFLRHYFGFLRFYERRFLAEESIPNLIIKEFKLYSDTLGRCVYFHYDTEKEDGIFGLVIDIGEKGELILKTSNGISEFTAGEIIYVF